MALNSYADRVRAALIQALPHLAQYISETELGALLVRVPPPRIASGLVLTTEGDEVSIGFRTWHTHGELLGASSPDEHIHAALDLVKRILEGRVQIAVGYVDGQFEDAWITDDPASEQRYVQPNERLTIGTWAELAA